MRTIGRVLIKFAPMRWVIRTLAPLLLAIPAMAHPVPFSYLDFQLNGSSIDISLTIHIYDLVHDLQVNPMERLLDAAFLAQRDSAIRTLLTPRLEMAADGHRLQPEWLEPEILQDRQSVRFHLRNAVSATPGVISLSTVMFP